MTDTVRQGLFADINERREYYSHNTCCGNCGKHQTCYVKKGTPLNGLSIKCEDCHCRIRLLTFASNWTDSEAKP